MSIPIRRSDWYQRYAAHYLVSASRVPPASSPTPGASGSVYGSGSIVQTPDDPRVVLAREFGHVTETRDDGSVCVRESASMRDAHAAARRVAADLLNGWSGAARGGGV